MTVTTNTTRRIRTRRGFTLIETLLAMCITAMVGGGIATMMSVLSRDVGLQYEARGVLIRTSTAQTRFSAYVAPSRCILQADADGLVLWLEDARESDTVHASELRWIRHDAGMDSIVVDFVAFPDTWSETAVALADTEHASSTRWSDVRRTFDDLGLLSTAPLVDEVSSVTFRTPTGDTLNSRLIEADIELKTTQAPVPIHLGETIRILRPPTQ